MLAICMLTSQKQCFSKNFRRPDPFCRSVCVATCAPVAPWAIRMSTSSSQPMVSGNFCVFPSNRHVTCGSISFFLRSAILDGCCCCSASVNFFSAFLFAFGTTFDFFVIFSISFLDLITWIASQLVKDLFVRNFSCEWGISNYIGSS
jgi:hypothetical protein